MLRAVQRTAVAAALAFVAFGGQQATARIAGSPERACGPLRGSPVTAVFATVVTCREAFRIARTHAASVRRNGSCKTRRIGCNIGRFRCLYAYKPEIKNKVLCTWRGDEKVIFLYRK